MTYACFKDDCGKSHPFLFPSSFLPLLPYLFFDHKRAGQFSNTLLPGRATVKPLKSWPTNHRLNPLTIKQNNPSLLHWKYQESDKETESWLTYYLTESFPELYPTELWFDWPQLQRGLIGNFQNNKKHCQWKEIILNCSSKTPYSVCLTLQPMPVWEWVTDMHPIFSSQ